MRPPAASSAASAANSRGRARRRAALVPRGRRRHQRAPGDRGPQVGRDARAVQQVPGAVGERAGVRAVEARAAATRAPASRSPMFLSARAAAATLAAREGRTSTMSTRSGIHGCISQPRNPLSCVGMAFARGPRVDPAASAAAPGHARPLPARRRGLGRADGGPRQAQPRGLLDDHGRGPRPLRHQRAMEGRVLPRREDRVPGRPDDPPRRRLRAAGGRPAADDAARRLHRGAPAHLGHRGPRVPAAVVRVLPRPGHRAHLRRRAGRGKTLRITVHDARRGRAARPASWPSLPR